MHATNQAAKNSNKMLVEDQMQSGRGANSLLGAPRLSKKNRFKIASKLSSKFEIRTDGKHQENDESLQLKDEEIEDTPRAIKSRI